MNAASGIDEGALVRRLRERSIDREAAFAEIFAAYRLPVFTVCRHLTRSAADAEDATQETFVALLRALPGFRGDSALRTSSYFRMNSEKSLCQKAAAGRTGSPAMPGGCGAT